MESHIRGDAAACDMQKSNERKIAAEHDVWLYHRKAQMGALHTHQKAHTKRKYQIPTTQCRQHYSMHGMHNARPSYHENSEVLHDGEMPSRATIRIITIQFFLFKLSVFSRFAYTSSFDIPSIAFGVREHRPLRVTSLCVYVESVKCFCIKSTFCGSIHDFIRFATCVRVFVPLNQNMPTLSSSSSNCKRIKRIISMLWRSEARQMANIRSQSQRATSWIAHVQHFNHHQLFIATSNRQMSSKKTNKMGEHLSPDSTKSSSKWQTPARV